MVLTFHSSHDVGQDDIQNSRLAPKDTGVNSTKLCGVEFLRCGVLLYRSTCSQKKKNNTVSGADFTNPLSLRAIPHMHDLGTYV